MRIKISVEFRTEAELKRLADELLDAAARVEAHAKKSAARKPAAEAVVVAYDVKVTS